MNTLIEKGGESADEVGAFVTRFKELFGGNPNAYGVYGLPTAGEPQRRPADGKVNTSPYVRKEPLTEDVVREHLTGTHGGFGYGVVLVDEQGQCSAAALDCDTYKGFDRTERLEELRRKGGTFFVPCVSKSGGLHCWVFFSSPQDAGSVRKRLLAWADALPNWNPAKRELEVFPKQERVGEGRVGNWIAYPYVDALRPERYGSPRCALRADASQIAEVEEFLSVAEAARLAGLPPLPSDDDRDPLSEAEGFEDAPPCVARMAHDKVGEGGRNNGLFQMGVYALLKHGAEELSGHLHRMNMAYIDPPLSSGDVDNIVKSLRRKEYFYRCKEQPAQSLCHRSNCLKRKFGVGQTPDGLEERDVANLFAKRFEGQVLFHEREDRFFVFQNAYIPSRDTWDSGKADNRARPWYVDSDKHLGLRDVLQHFIDNELAPTCDAKAIKKYKANRNVMGIVQQLMTILRTRNDFNQQRAVWGLADGRILDLTGEDVVVRDATTADRVTWTFGTTYDPSVQLPERWLQFQREVCDGDEELMAFKQRLEGYMLNGTNSEHKIVVHVGDAGRNGKGTEDRVRQAVLGDYTAVVEETTLLQQSGGKKLADPDKPRTDLLMLANRLYGPYHEQNNHEHRFSQSRIKRITGGDRETARGMFSGERVDIDHFPLIHIFTNNFPNVESEDDSYRGRFIAIEWLVSFKGREELDLDKKLVREAQGILSWMVEGWRQWKARGRLDIPARCTEAVDEYHRANHPIFALKDVLIPDPQGGVEVEELYQVYMKHARSLVKQGVVQAQHASTSLYDFVKQCKQSLGLAHKESGVMRGGNRKAEFLGVRLDPNHFSKLMGLEESDDYGGASFS